MINGGLIVGQGLTKANGMFKVFFFVLSYLSVLVFSGRLLPKLKIDFITNNLTFFTYAIVFLLAIILFPTQIFNAFGKMRKAQFTLLFSVGAITFAAEVLAGILVSIFNIDNLNQSGIDSARMCNTFLLNLTIILLAPVSEEIMYRLCLFSLFPSHKAIAYIVSIALFAFMHVWNFVIIDGNITQIFTTLPYIALGAGLCFLFDKTDNIGIPIMLHMIINTISVIC